MNENKDVFHAGQISIIPNSFIKNILFSHLQSEHKSHAPKHDEHMVQV